MLWYRGDLGKAAVIWETGDSRTYRTPDHGLVNTDLQGRPILPAGMAGGFWELPRDQQVDTLLGMLSRVECSAAWVVERLDYLGVIPNAEAAAEMCNVLLGLQWGESVDAVKAEMRRRGVSVVGSS